MAVSFGVRNPYILVVAVLEGSPPSLTRASCFFFFFSDAASLVAGPSVILIYALRPLRGTQLGNLLWWCSMLCSTPLATVLYAREYYMRR